MIREILLRRVAVAGLVVGALALAGCAPSSPGPATGTPGATGGREVEQNVPVEIPAGVVATGDILLPDGSVYGTATLTWNSGALGVEIPDLVPLFGEEQSLVALADSDVDFTMCGTENLWQVGFGDAGTLAGLPMPDAVGDPSFYRYLLLMPYWREGECAEPIIGVARLEWSVPVTRPWLTVADSGPAVAAQGQVLVVDGSPVAYRTAPGDTWYAIAARFGITTDDLSYLNPIRSGGSQPETAYAHQILNLDPSNRGDSETRRWGSDLSLSDAFRE